MLYLKLNVFQKALVYVLVAAFVIYFYIFGQFIIENNSLQEDKSGAKDGNNGYLIYSAKCKIPNLKPFNEEMQEFYSPLKHLNCTKKDLLTYTIVHDSNNSASLYINQSLLSEYSINNDQSLNCCYSFVHRKPNTIDPDRYVKYDKCIDFTSSVALESDVVKVVCHSDDKMVYENVHAVITVNRSLINPSRLIKKHPRPINVLLIGVDSMSRLNLIRQMPQTYHYLETNNWLSILGYNKIDDNTFPNVMAILTGLDGNAQKKTCKPHLVDGLINCPLIWNEFKKMGYVTAYAEDEAYINTFNHERKGFKVDPVDHYFRKYSLAVQDLEVKIFEGANYCTGPEVSGQRILDLAESFSSTYLNLAPTFGLFWMNSFSHNSFNAASMMDSEMVDFFGKLNNSGVLDDSLVIFFSDHGLRAGNARFTHSGWLEERLPFLYLSVPKWFRNHYAKEYENLKGNREKLSSNYEFHITLRHVLNLSGADLKKSSDSCPKCQSFFDDLPPNRSCEELGISQHWCTCSTLVKLNRWTEREAKSAEILIHIINDKILKRHRKACVRYELDHIMEMYREKGSVPITDNIIIMVRVRTQPNATFEATIQYSPRERIGPKYMLRGDISRLDKYGSTSKCMEDAYLQKFCHCIK